MEVEHVDRPGTLGTLTRGRSRSGRGKRDKRHGGVSRGTYNEWCINNIRGIRGWDDDIEVEAQ